MGDDKVYFRQLRSPLSKEVLRRQLVKHVGATNDHNILLKLPLMEVVSSTQLDHHQKKSWRRGVFIVGTIQSRSEYIDDTKRRKV